MINNNILILRCQSKIISWSNNTMDPYIPSQLPLECIDWEQHITLIGKANSSLARYDGILQSIVNPNILLSPLMTREAVLSSRIEGTRVSLEDALQYNANIKEFQPDKLMDLHEVSNYRNAMSYAISALENHPLALI